MYWHLVSRRMRYHISPVEWSRFLSHDMVLSRMLPLTDPLPAKWHESRSELLQSLSYAVSYHVEIAASVVFRLTDLLRFTALWGALSFCFPSRVSYCGALRWEIALLNQAQGEEPAHAERTASPSNPPKCEETKRVKALTQPQFLRFHTQLPATHKQGNSHEDQTTVQALVWWQLHA